MFVSRKPGPVISIFKTIAYLSGTDRFFVCAGTRTGGLR
jgi:hypothetical protein